jgi:hypothetical protein
MKKPKVLWVGGKPFNVPDEFHERFDIVRHIEQDEKRLSGSLPNVDFILILTNWVSHKAETFVRTGLPDVPVVWTGKGWNSIKVELERRGLLQPEVSVVEPIESQPIPADIQKALQAYQDKLALVRSLEEARKMRQAEVENLSHQIGEAREWLESRQSLMSTLQAFIQAARASGSVM